VTTVLMDIEMPELDGLAATMQIREHESAARLPRVPIVAMTANAMRDDRARAFEAGMDDFLAKPLAREDLRITLAAMANRWQRRLNDETSNTSESSKTTPPAVGGSGEERRLRVLVADDSEPVRQLVAHVLAGMGVAEVVQAVDGDDALTKLMDEKASFDGVLLDVNMPHASGVEVVRRLRTQNVLGRDGKRLVVVAMTGDEGDATLLADGAFDNVVAKPVSKDALEAFLATLRSSSTLQRRSTSRRRKHRAE